ncbi:MAG: tripartite tricarboxylate transporter substrate binding protein [Burkholderiales bacterium]
MYSIRGLAFSQFVLLVGIIGPAPAQNYPTRPIRIIDGFPAGGAPRVLARTIGQHLTERWKQPVIVDNRPGASSNLGAELAAKAPPDGYTLFIGATSALATSTDLYPGLAFDPVRDLTAVTQVASGALVLLLHPAVSAKSVTELIALAKLNPGQMRYASSGVGAPLHLAAELFKQQAKIDLTHVAYKGGVPATTAIVSGETQLGFSSLAAALPFVRGARVHAVAVSTPARSSALPDVPTIAESGLAGFDVTVWYGILAPAGTPVRVIDKLSTEIVGILALPDVVDRLATLGLNAKGSTPGEFRATLHKEVTLWRRVIRDAGIKAP